MFDYLFLLLFEVPQFHLKGFMMINSVKIC